MEYLAFWAALPLHLIVFIEKRYLSRKAQDVRNRGACAIISGLLRGKARIEDTSDLGSRSRSVVSGEARLGNSIYKELDIRKNDNESTTES